MVWAGTDLRGHLVPSPCHGQGWHSWDQIAWVPFQSCLGHFQKFKSIMIYEKKKNDIFSNDQINWWRRKKSKTPDWGTNLFMQGGSKDPGRKRECQAVMGLCEGTTFTKTPPGRGDRAMPWPGELGKAVLHSQNNPPYTSSATLQIVLLNKTPKPLSSFPSQLSWASLWQQFLPEVFRLCSHGQSARDLRQTGLLRPKKL